MTTCMDGCGSRIELRRVAFQRPLAWRQATGHHSHFLFATACKAPMLLYRINVSTKQW